MKKCKCKNCGKEIEEGKFCSKKCEKSMKEGFDFRGMVRAYIAEARAGRGTKAMAKSVGLSVGAEKNEVHKLEKKGVMADIKKRASKADNPKAYLFGTERKILKAHAKKMGK
jgi:hypothetical protein